MDVKELLKQEEMSRDDILRKTNDELENKTMKLFDYSVLLEDYNNLQKEAKRIALDSKDNLIKLREIEMELLKKEEEIRNVKADKKVLAMFLEKIIDRYGINEISKTLGIPYIKLKEYLQD